MIYREYGQTGKKVSLLGFGGMRFKNVDNHEECVRMIVAAAEGGVNYFDTAPGYFETRSETVFGKGFAELRQQHLPYFAATKTFKSTESDIKREIDAQLKRLDIPAIDFYHVWCINDLNNWEKRKSDGVLKTFRKLKEQGLIKHICVSSHLTKNEIQRLLMEGVFEGVLFGYSIYNFHTREEAFDAITAKNLGAVVMNPLGGGVIPQHPEKFGFLCRPGETMVDAALHFLWDHPQITSTLVGFENMLQIKEALHALQNYKLRSAAELTAVKAKAADSADGICTGCGYCDSCPERVPIPQYMDAYNQKLLAKEGNKDPIGDRLYWHWSLERAGAGNCTACGQCEASCTQHLKIIERLKEIAGK